MGIRDIIRQLKKDSDHHNGVIIRNPPDKLDDVMFQLMCIEKQLDNLHSRVDDIEDTLGLRTTQ